MNPTKDKEKYKDYIKTRMQSSKYKVNSTIMKVHWPIIFGVITFVTLVYYFTNSNSVSDRSQSFNVKVIPNDLDDKALAALDPLQFSYVAVIDAGSSGCRAHVYRYGKLGDIKGKLYILPQHHSVKFKPGTIITTKTSPR